jgi:hypothetical protein
MRKNKRPTRTELKEYITNLEKLLFLSNVSLTDVKTTFQLVSNNLSFEFKSQLAKNIALISFSEEPDIKSNYDKASRIKDFIN